VRFALHIGELVHPLDPVHDQDHGPVPVRDVGVPVVQRLVMGEEEGIVGIVVPFAVPHTPLMGDGGGGGADPTVILTLPVALPHVPVQLRV
jgi:hypothetical protein